MFKYIVEGFKKNHLKNMVVRDERVLSFYNLDTAKKCIVFWVADDVPVASVNKVRGMLAKYMEVCLIAFIRQPKSNPEQMPDALYLDSSGISYKGKFNDLKVQEILDEKEALLIDLSLKPDVWGDYIVKYAKSSCKVGFNHYGTEHDIDFDEVRDIDDFMRRLFELLTKINTY